MGIENRDYLRNEYGGGSWNPSFAGGQVVKWLIIVNIGVFILQLLTAGNGLVNRWFQMAPGDILERFQIWRLITYAFLHDNQDVWHIFWNMLILYWVGPRMEQRYGSKEFLWFYLTAAFVGGLMYILLALILRQAAPVIGASGAVTAVFIVYALHYPREIWRLFFIFPIEVRWICLVKIVFDLHPVLLAVGGGGVHSNVAHACHLGGWVFGYLYVHNGWRLTDMFDGLERIKRQHRRRKSNLRVYDPHADSTEMDVRRTTTRQRDTAEMDAQVDEILAKISREGEASLTADERSTLADASRRLRDRSRS